MLPDNLATKTAAKVWVKMTAAEKTKQAKAWIAAETKARIKALKRAAEAEAKAQTESLRFKRNQKVLVAWGNKNLAFQGVITRGPVKPSLELARSYYSTYGQRMGLCYYVTIKENEVLTSSKCIKPIK